MKNKVKRTIYMMLFAVILFSGSMAVPSINNSSWKNLMQGAALGLMLAGIVIIIATLIEHLRAKK